MFLTALLDNNSEHLLSSRKFETIISIPFSEYFRKRLKFKQMKGGGGEKDGGEWQLLAGMQKERLNFKIIPSYVFRSDFAIFIQVLQVLVRCFALFPSFHVSCT